MLAGKRHLITGGAGLVGSHIADQLVKEDAKEIVVIDDFTRGTLKNLKWASDNGNVTIVEGDIRDTKLLKEVTEGIDTVFHEAAIRITQCAEEPRYAHDVLATGTFNVLEAAVNAQVRKVVAASSASIYGQAEDFPTQENHHPYANDTIYGAAKVYNEGLYRSFKAMFDLDYVAFRYFNVFGPRMDIYGVYTEVLVRWMEKIEAGEPPLIFGDGTQTMDFVFIEDIALANILGAKSDVTDEVFNVASGVETSLLELAQTLMKVMGKEMEVEYREARKVNPVHRRLASTDKAKKLIGFEAQNTLYSGLEKLVKWWREQKLQ